MTLPPKHSRRVVPETGRYSIDLDPFARARPRVSNRVRGRDLRAVAFLVISTLAVAGGLAAATGNLIVAAVATAIYGYWLLGRPRMVRVVRRLRGAPDFSGYFDG